MPLYLPFLVTLSKVPRPTSLLAVVVDERSICVTGFRILSERKKEAGAPAVPGLTHTLLLPGVTKKRVTSPFTTEPLTSRVAVEDALFPIWK